MYQALAGPFGVADWLNEPPDERLMVSDETAAPYTIQLTSLRITRYLGTHRGVAAIHLGPTVWSGIVEGVNLATLVRLISAEYGGRLNRRTKTVVMVGNGIQYTVPSGGVIATRDTVVEDTRILFADLHIAEQLAHYGKAELFIFVKRGSFCNQYYNKLLRSMARAMDKGRVGRILILCEAAAYPAVIQRGRQIFKNLEFVYEEVTY